MKYLVTFFLLTLTVCSISQDIVWGDPVDLIKTKGYSGKREIDFGYDMLAYNDEFIIKYEDSQPYDGFYFYKRRKQIKIQYFNREDLTLDEEIIIETDEALHEDEYYIGVNFFNGTTYMTVGKESKEDDDIIEIYLRPFDKYESIFKDPIDLGSVTKKDNYYGTNLPRGYLRARSDDGNLNAYYTRRYEKGEGVDNEFRIFQNDKEDWETISYKTSGLRDFWVKDFCIGDDGSFCVLAFPYVEQETFFQKDRELQGYFIYRIEDSDVKHSIFKYDKTTSAVMSVIPSNEGNFIFFGHNYSNAFMELVYTNSFTQILDQYGLGSVKKIEYGNDFLIELWNEKEKSKAIEKGNYPDGFTGIGYPDIHYGGDGIRYAIFRVSHTENLEDISYHPDRLPYVRDNLVVVKMNNDGKLLWKKNIYMRRATENYSANDGDASRYFQTFWINERIYIMFNENIKGPDGEDVKTRVISIDAEGKVKEEFSTMVKSYDMMIRPEYTTVLEETQMLIYAADKREMRFGLINLSEDK